MDNIEEQKSKAIGCIILGSVCTGVKPVLSAINENGVNAGIQSSLELAEAMNTPVATVLFIILTICGIGLAGWGLFRLIKAYTE